MVELPYNLYIAFIGIIVLLSALLVGVILSYFASLRKLSRFERKENEIINAAQEKAADIISHAGDIEDTSRATLEKAVSDLEKREEAELSEKSADAIAKFEERIEELNSNNIKEFNNVSEKLIETINLHYEELKKLLAQQTVESQKQADIKIKQEYDDLERELQTYKQEQIDKIHKNIYQILFNVSKNVFGTKLDVKEHEQMIVNALEQAEKEIN